MDTGGNEAWEVADCLIGGTGPGADQAVLVLGLDGEHVDEVTTELSARIAVSRMRLLRFAVLSPVAWSSWPSRVTPTGQRLQVFGAETHQRVTQNPHQIPVSVS